MLHSVDRRIILCAMLGALAAGCGQSSPTSPTTTTAASTTAVAAASVSSVMPASLPPSQATQTLVVQGANFKPGLSVILTTQAASSSNGGRVTADTTSQTFTGSAIQNLTDGSFQVSVTVPGPGTYTLTVVNPSSSPSGSVTVTAETSSGAPSIAGLSPNTLTQSSATQPVYVAGINFQSGLAALITSPDGATTTVDSSSMTFGSPTIFKMLVALSQAGGYSLRVVNPSGDASDPFSFTVNAPDTPVAPTVSSLSPAAPVADSAAQMVYVSGANFQGGLTVALMLPDGTTSTVGGSAITFGSSTIFKITTTLANTGDYSVRVTNPSGLSSDAFAFSVTAPAAPTPPTPPTVTGLVSPAPVAGTASQMVYFSGTGFQSGLTVALTLPDGSTSTLSGSAVTFGTSAIFKITTPLVSPGSYSVRVTNPSGLSSDPFAFVVKAPDAPVAPTVTSISPSTPVAGATLEGLYISGTGFQTGPTVVLTLPDGSTSTFSGSAVTFGSSTIIKIIPTLSTAGGYSVRVTNASGLSSNVFAFSVAAPVPPTVTGLSPSSPVAAATAQMVYISGTGFQTGLSVTLTLPNGTTTTLSGSAITLGSSTVFKITVILSDPGAYSLQVVNPSGPASAVYAFTVAAGS